MNCFSFIFGSKAAIDLTKYCSPIILGLALNSCSKPPPGTSTCFIRVQNQTGRDWSEVIVHTNNFGTIENGVTTEYQTTATLSDNPYFSASATNGRFFYWRKRRLELENHRIESGRYTFTLERTTNDIYTVTRKRDF